MAYAQWIKVSVEAQGLKISIQNARLAWGKFHQEGNKDSEISSSEIDQIKISDGSTATISSCGRADAASGTEGSFDVYDTANTNKIGTFSWECAWGSRHNTYGWSDGGLTNYMARVDDGNTDSGAIGTVRLKVAKKA